MQINKNPHSSGPDIGQTAMDPRHPTSCCSPTSTARTERPVAVRPADQGRPAAVRGHRRRAESAGRAARPVDGRAGVGIARPALARDAGRMQRLRLEGGPLRSSGVANQRLAVGILRANGAGEEFGPLAAAGSGLASSTMWSAGGGELIGRITPQEGVDKPHWSAKLPGGFAEEFPIG